MVLFTFERESMISYEAETTENYLRDGTVIRGKRIADEILEELRLELEAYPSRPKIVDILVGEDMPSRVYIRMKEKAAARIGAVVETRTFPGDVSRETLFETLEELNSAEDVHGIILERPLPSPLDYGGLVSAISFRKDVEGLHARNLGAIIQNSESLAPATPQGILLLLDRLNIALQGKDVTIINHSPTVGRPLAEMFLNRDATVSVCHVFTKDLKRFTLQSDIIVVAVGVPGFLKADMVPGGCVVIDVGFNRDEDGKPCGDYDFFALKEKVGYITPVPGGVGPMTVASLMKNCTLAFRRQMRERGELTHES